ncbi:ParB/RepB/Spo0J family partition protein [Streptomyces griseorubens]|uniref:ParB/RepB/Spo0J family partition protein n=1 Tax=Streptomyces griseorubens TaxID=66897 RepID=UPI003513D37A
MTPVFEATQIPPSDISFNPDNPREELGDVSDLTESFQEVGQIVALTIATVDAYLTNRPDRRGDLEEGAKFVVIDGNRRLKAAREASLPTVKVMLADEFAATDESLLEAAFIANAKREGLSELEEAQALDKLVKFYGSQHKAAKRLGISQPLISQKISLLSLTPELQADLEAGRRNVSHLRNLAKHPPAEQRKEADRRARLDAEKKSRRTKRSSSAAPEGDNSVIILPDVSSHAGPPQPPVSVPVQAAEPAGRQPVLFPYGDGKFAAQLLMRKMPADQLDVLTDLLNEHRKSV